VLQQEVRQDLVTATAASSIVACFIMGAMANMPLALAPG
jgi:adenine/guanine/hypoxanthine permease